jgi:hypothetical protein
MNAVILQRVREYKRRSSDTNVGVQDAMPCQTSFAFLIRARGEYAFALY